MLEIEYHSSFDFSSFKPLASENVQGPYLQCQFGHVSSFRAGLAVAPEI